MSSGVNGRAVDRLSHYAHELKRALDPALDRHPMDCLREPANHLLEDAQRLLQWAQVSFVVLPSANRIHVNRFPDLGVTGCADGPSFLVE